MQKVALSSKEEGKLVASIMYDLYKSKLTQWKSSEKKQIKVIIKDLAKIFSAFPNEEIYKQKLDLYQAFDDLLITLKNSEKNQCECQGVKKIIEDFGETLKLYQEILQGVRVNYEFNRKIEDLKMTRIDQVENLYRELKNVQGMGKENLRKLSKDLIE